MSETTRSSDSNRLIVRENGRERTFDLGRESVSIGRSKDNAIKIDDVSSSRRHCRVQQSTSGWVIEDLQSRNGTLVNGILVRKKELQPGDCIEIGKTRLYFERVPTEELLTESGGETLILPTDYFMEPLTEPLESSKHFQKEREIFLRLLDLSKRLSSTLVLRELLDLVLDTVLEITGAERGFVIMRDEGDLKVMASRNIDREAVKRAEMKVSHTITARVMKAGRPVLTGDARSDKKLGDLKSVVGLKLESVLCVPLRIRGSTIGVIYVDNRFEKYAFHQNHLRFIEFLAGQAAVNLENARLFEENLAKQEDLRKAKEQSEFLNRELQDMLMASDMKVKEATDLLTRKSEPSYRYDYHEIITKSPKMYQIFEMLDRVIETDVPVLIQGESGTGKELVARAIHEQGKRARKEFVSINCAAIPPNLLESEFFGHVRGAFTGAVQNKQGLFELAADGTLFLDEIGDMSLDLQTKLLRVLEDGEIRRVGGKKIIKVDVRILSATNRPLREMIGTKEFRDDLYYRLNVINITLPPLRERKEDIPLLVEFFLGRIKRPNGAPRQEIESRALYQLMQYHWPGNIRELQNEVQRISALAEETIQVEHLSQTVMEAGEARLRGGLPQGTLREVIASRTEELERDVIERSLVEMDWNKSKTSKLLGVSRPTLDQKIGKYQLKKPARPKKKDR